MNTPPEITDRHALALHRQRSRRMETRALFLHEDAADEVQERLTEVNRAFTSPAIVTAFPEVWSDRLPSALTIPDDETLALASEAHDLIVHFLSLHWSNDPVGQLIQCRRALKPDGLFMCALFGGQTLSELRAALSEAEIAVTGGLSPRILPMGEIRDLGALLQRAGFALPVADSAKRCVTYGSALHLIQDLRGMGETNALSQRHRAMTPRSLFERTAANYASAFKGSDGRIPATFEVIFLTGWAPDASQQKPLSPGSANHRLADALGADELSLNDPAKPR